MDTSAERSRPAAAMEAAVLVLVALLAMLGAALALSALRGGDDPPPPVPPAARAGDFVVGDVVPTSFGVVSADHVERTPGPTAKALSGA